VLFGRTEGWIVSWPVMTVKAHAGDFTQCIMYPRIVPMFFLCMVHSAKIMAALNESSKVKRKGG